jgi:hypothetical protein
MALADRNTLSLHVSKPAEFSMKLPIRVSVSAIAAAVMLASCASKGPTNSTGTASSGAGDRHETSSEYQRLADNAAKQVVCRRQAVTGTLVPSVVCLTRAEMDERRANASQVMRDIRANEATSRSIADQPPSVPASAPRGTP